MAKRPLIFIEPMTESLRQLKDILAPVADIENIEIMTVENLDEAMQLIPTIGASLTLFTEAKKTALLLKTHGKRLIKNNSKVMLVTKQRIPQKSLEKMMKFGLSEYILEPIVPKSLMYKVKLLLRALPSEDKKPKEMSLKTNDVGQLKLDNNMDLKKTKDATNSLAIDDMVNETEKSNALVFDDPEEENEPTEKKSEDKYSSHYQGKIKKEKKEDELEEDLYETKKSEKSKIETNYMGETSTSELNLEADEEANDEKNDNIIDDVLKGKITSSKLDLEADDNDSDNIERRDEDSQNKKSNDNEGALEFEDDEDNSSENGQEKIDTYMKGKLNRSELQEDEETKSDFENNEKAEEETEENSKDHQSQLDFEDESASDLLKREDEIEDTEKIKKKKKEDIESEEQDEYKDTDQIDPEEEKKSHDGTAEHIDTYDRSEDFQKTKEGPGNMASSDSTDMGLDLEKDHSNSGMAPQEESDILSEDSTDMNLHLEAEDPSPKDKKENEETEDFPKDGEEGMDHDSAYTDEEVTKERLENEAEEFDERKKRKEAPEEEKTDSDEAEKEEADNTEDYLKVKKKKNNESEDDQNEKEWIAREEVEKKHHEREMRKEDDMGNWEKLTPEAQEELEEFAKEQYEKELIIKKINYGEQTIDYGRLKKEFDLIEKYGRDAVKNAYQIVESGAGGAKYSSKVKGAVPFSVEISERVIENNNKEIKEETDTVYPPDSKGLELAILALNLIEDKKLNEAEIYSNIGQMILREYLGHSVFFRFNTETQTIEIVYQVDTDLIKQQFETYKHLYFEMWKKLMLPYWSDETFQAKEVFFIYPFFEGTKSMGFAFCIFGQGLSAEKAPRVEVLMESLRTMYLDYSHKSAPSGNYKSIQNAKEKPEVSSSIFDKISSWFKKAG